MTSETRYYAHYVDDGPSQAPNDKADPNPWDRLYVFSRPKAWLDFQHDVSVEPYRENARIIGAWAEGDPHYDQIVDWRDDPAR